MTQETITTDELTEDPTLETTDELPEDLHTLGTLILLGWKRIYSFRSPAGHRYAVHVDGPTIANIHLKTSEAVITYNRVTQKPEYINPTRLQNF